MALTSKHPVQDVWQTPGTVPAPCGQCFSGRIQHSSAEQGSLDLCGTHPLGRAHLSLCKDPSSSALWHQGSVLSTTEAVLEEGLHTCLCFLDGKSAQGRQENRTGFFPLRMLLSPGRLSAGPGRGLSWLRKAASHLCSHETGHHQPLQLHPESAFSAAMGLFSALVSQSSSD